MTSDDIKDYYITQAEFSTTTGTGTGVYYYLPASEVTAATTNGWKTIKVETHKAPKVVTCSRCRSLVEVTDENRDKLKYVNQGTASAVSNLFYLKAYIYCEACERWFRRKRWIRCGDEKEYGAWQKGKMANQ